MAVHGDKYFTDNKGRKYLHYDFVQTTPIHRLDCKDKDVDVKIKRQHPVVIENTHLVDAAEKWDLEYLTNNLGGDKKNVFVSTNHKFMYHNEKRCMNYPLFKPPTKQVELTVAEFAQRIDSWEPGQDRLYYQQMLTDTVGPRIYDDFRDFRWDWLTSKQAKYGWGSLTSNLLLIGMPGNVTPAHYDEQQNFFAQVHGYKRVLLFAPKYFECLYPYPFYHPCDRQSQVDFENPDFEKFPLLKYLHAYEAVVGPGDVLFIPMYWWHYIESTQDSPITTSINFWYKNTTMTLQDLQFPLNWQQKTTMSRNIEKMLGEALGSPSEIGPFLTTILNGRYQSPSLSQEDFDF